MWRWKDSSYGSNFWPKLVICDAEPDVRVRIRRGIVDVEHERPSLRAVVPVAVYKVSPKREYIRLFFLLL